MNNKGKVIALCGKIASGKTYYANKLKEQENAVIFSVDELTYYLYDNRRGEDYRNITKRALNYFRTKAIDIVNRGITVIIDSGLWSLEARKEMKDFFINTGIKCEIHYIDIDDESWENNINKRNHRIDEGDIGTDFYVTDSLKALLLESWQEPNKEEIDVWYKFKNEEE